MRLRKSMSRIARTLSCSSTYSRIDSSGSIEIDQRFSAISTSWKPTSVCSKIREAFSCEETSQTIVRLPASAARSPSATATVVLPTPPLPVTKTSRLSSNSGIGVIPSNFEGWQEKRVPMRIPAQWDSLAARSRSPRPVDVVEETHPIVEELQAMEEAVPERVGRGTTRDRGPEAAGPVAAGHLAAVLRASSEAPYRATRGRGPRSRDRSVAEATRGLRGEGRWSRARFMPDLIAPRRHEPWWREPAAEHADKHADVIAFANQKGGVAKTTTTLNLAVAFAESGHRVLCIDLDPQGNLTMSQGIDPGQGREEPLRRARQRHADQRDHPSARSTSLSPRSTWPGRRSR